MALTSHRRGFGVERKARGREAPTLREYGRIPRRKRGIGFEPRRNLVEKVPGPIEIGGGNSSRDRSPSDDDRRRKIEAVRQRDLARHDAVGEGPERLVEMACRPDAVAPEDAAVGQDEVVDAP